ncbi:MAG: protein phosphatase 2C domain-containing protein [Muribaculaceae bacterium]|nr:protein phosphatase 2C domain-containing protein [Muribaculaceae bacterium]
MIKLITKSFLLGKDNEPDGRQDALSVNDPSAIYAVADGVSNSFHPEMVARDLCQTFTSLSKEGEEFKDWNSFSRDYLLPSVAQNWNIGVHNYMTSLQGRLLRHEKFNYERWKFGASTFCGVTIDLGKGILRYYIIGDSTLFVMEKSGELKEYNTSPKMESSDSDLVTVYSNSTCAITSQNHIVGEWLIGEILLAGVKSIALMTDGMAMWYQKLSLSGEDPFAILWNIQGNEAFRDLAMIERTRNNEMDDDLAVILIKLEESSTETRTLDAKIIRKSFIYPYTKRFVKPWKIKRKALHRKRIRLKHRSYKTWLN